MTKAVPAQAFLPKKSMNTPSFTDHVKGLVEEAEEEAAAIGPFMSRLSSLLP